MGGRNGTWLKVCERAGVSNLRLHDFRSFGSSEGHGQGIDLETVAAVLGHSSSTTTRKHYVRVNDRIAAEATRLMSSKTAKAFGLEQTQEEEGE
jgi:integrase